MSSVLRPLRAIKKNNESVEDKNVAQAIPEVVPSLVSSSVEESKIITEKIVNVELPHDSEEKVQVAQPVSQEEKIREEELVKEEEKKEEKISAVLQEILDRKIDKAIINAEASLESPLPSATSGTQEGVVVVAQSVDTVISSLPTAVPDQAQNVPVEIIKTPGQEIHIPLPVQAVDQPSNQTTVTPVVTPPSVVSNINVIPVHVTTQEALPVVASVEQNTLPVAPLPLQQNQTTSVQVAVPEQKVHWFDRLFGSVPKSPPQST